MKPVSRSKSSSSWCGNEGAVQHLSGRVLVHSQNHHGVHVQPIEEPSVVSLVSDPQFVAPRPDARHGARVGESQAFPPLQAAQ